MRLFFIIFTVINVSLGFSQKADSTEKSLHKKMVHSPRKASLFSAILPGAGQVYNRKAWKVPIIYVGLGGLGYVFVNSQKNYTYYRTNLRNETDTDLNTSNETGLDVSSLQSEKLRFRKYRDLSAFGLIVVYAVNIIDANVDAHLKTFDISDDLSLRISATPLMAAINGNINYSAGLKLKFNF